MSGRDYRPLTDTWDLRAENEAYEALLAHQEALVREQGDLSTDTMLLARSKVKFYGAYPAGFLGRARAYLCRESEPLLHVCGGLVKKYPFAGLGPRDRTVDLDEKTSPDYLMDVRELGTDVGDKFPEGPLVQSADGFGMMPPNIRTVTKVSGPPPENQLWPAALIDRPYTLEDAKNYLDGQGAAVFPDELNDLLRRTLQLIVPGGRVGVLDYLWPQPPKKGVRCVAAVSVLVGFNNRVRLYSVYEKEYAWRKILGAGRKVEEMDADEQDAADIAAHGTLEPAGAMRGVSMGAAPLIPTTAPPATGEPGIHPGLRAASEKLAATAEHHPGGITTYGLNDIKLSAPGYDTSHVPGGADRRHETATDDI